MESVSVFPYAKANHFARVLNNEATDKDDFSYSVEEFGGAYAVAVFDKETNQRIGYL